ncbi:MAG TPA: LysE family transporter [Patescibacteria group bacterium]|nr:LysE family transporter [Patescibacteria group bacterium]
MLAAYLVKGLFIGFSIAAPVGPIGLLCIRRTLSAGLLVGLLSGLGAATADAIYGLVAGLGLTMASGFLQAQQAWLRGFGGLFLLFLAYKNFHAKPAETNGVCKPSTLARAYLSTFLLTLTNPMTIFAFAGIFAGLGMADSGTSFPRAATLVAGVFTGSALWWLFLCGTVEKLRDRLGARQYQMVNRLAALLIGIFGAAALGSLFEI